MRRPTFETLQGSPEQAPQHSPEQLPQRSPDQALQQTQQRTLRTPELELTQQNTPVNMPHQTPQNTPQQMPEQNTTDESSLVTNNDVWKVGTMHTDGRLRVEVIEKVLEPSCKCSHKIRSIMYERLEPTGFTWKKVSKETKQFYFEEFKKWFVWKQPDNIIYEGFLKSAAIRFKDLRSRARAQWESKSELNNRIGSDVWLSWIEEWKTPECQAKTEKKRQNRRGGVDHGDYSGTHTGGSASSRTHAARLAEEWERDPNTPELFEYLHTKNHDKVTYIDKKSAALAEKLKTLRAERSQPVDGSLLPQPIDENMLYYDAVGSRNKRNQIYGIGSTQDIFYQPNSNTLSLFSNSQPNTQKIQKLEAEVQEMKGQIKEMDEMKQRMRDIESLVARLLDSQH